VTPNVTLRPVTDADFDALFGLESDVEGSDMIAFLPREPGDLEAFSAHWTRIRTDVSMITRVVEFDGTFAGYAVSFVIDGERQVGYWIVRELWGRGIASAALAALIAEIPERPLWGSTASDNLGSQRVLVRAGFVFDRVERSHAPRRGTEIDEHVFRLD
jgi:RimJ/RimL family protein N-acetyltransferase